MRAVLVANPKGGAGKTTLATNLSGYFANRGKRTTLFDLDRQQSSLRLVAFRAPELPPITSVVLTKLRGVERSRRAPRAV